MDVLGHISYWVLWSLRCRSTPSMRVQFLVCAFSVRFPLRRRDGFSEAYFCVLFPLSYLLSASSRISIGHSMTLVWHLENGLSMSTNSAMAALRYGLTLAISRKRRAYLKGLLTPTGVSSPTCGSPRYFHLGQDDVNPGKTPKGDHAN